VRVGRFDTLQKCLCVVTSYEKAGGGSRWGVGVGGGPYSIIHIVFIFVSYLYSYRIRIVSYRIVSYRIVSYSYSLFGFLGRISFFCLFPFFLGLIAVFIVFNIGRTVVIRGCNPLEPGNRYENKNARY
jgi:hypothetical protein